MLELISFNSINTPIKILFISLILLSILFIFTVAIPKIIELLIIMFFSHQGKETYQKIIDPYQSWFGLIFLFLFADISILILATPIWMEIIEIPLSLISSILLIWLGIGLFKRFFDVYLLEAVLKSKQKINTEILIIGKFLFNSITILVVFLTFAQTHNINIIGLIASLGIGGLAVAFAAQKTLEQLLGGIVIYLDRPFVVDDYIGLPDGTFGRVEAIGLRSTKIRASGKGTLMVIPNSSLTQVNIENFTGAKKVITLIYLTFHRLLPDDEKAFIRQIILNSTMDIFGIAHRQTEVIFKEIINLEKEQITQAQINFFILGSGEVSMELRRQLLNIANQNITEQLKEYGIAFDIEDKIIDVDSPITI